jgi:hypothetical protein
MPCGAVRCHNVLSAIRTCITAARRADDEVFGTGPDIDVLRAVAERLRR